MLSYQHSFHAGNLADVHKHSLLAWILEYLTKKPKPLSYIETHAGRAVYDLNSAEALKTGEAAMGIEAARHWFEDTHPYAAVLNATKTTHGPRAYPGSPLIAEHFRRDGDNVTLAELHPEEARALRAALPQAKVHKQDGFSMAHALLPPEPRRGILLVDPSYEIKADYIAIPKHVVKWQRAWNVGIIVLWYPILTSAAHVPMLDALQAAAPDALRHEVRFPPARPGHGMIGSGLFVLRPPFGLAEAAATLEHRFDQLTG